MPFPLPTLLSVACLRIALELWRKPDIVNKIKRLFSSHPTSIFEPKILDRWLKIENQVVDKISHLSLPDLLKERTREAIQMIGHRIKIYADQLNDILPECNIGDFIHLIHFSPDGGIDNSKTATSVMKGIRNLDVKRRYIFACNNCLEDHVRSLWKKLPVQQRVKFLHPRVNNLYPKRFLVTYWSYFNKQKLDKFDSLMQQHEEVMQSDNINDYCVMNSIIMSNSVAVKYFLEKLTEQEWDKNIVRYAIYTEYKNVTFYEKIAEYSIPVYLADKFTELSFYLTSLMNEIQLKDMVERFNPGAFNIWFWREFWENRLIALDNVWDILKPDVYCELFNDLLKYYIRPKPFSPFLEKRMQMAFNELWRNIPDSYKREFFSNVYDKRDALHIFLLAVDVETLQLIFQNASVEERKKIINFSAGKDLIREDLDVLCRYYEANMTLSKAMKFHEHLDDFKNDVDIALSAKPINEEGWPFLETLQKWRENVQKYR